jgi:hypothetical protein
MNRLLKTFTVCLLLASCSAQAQNNAPPSPTPAATVQSAATPGGKRFTLKLTLTEKEDLKVKQGDVVVRDQIIADRSRDRIRLESQKQQIQLQLQRLKQPPIQPLAPKRIPDVAALPAPSFLEEQAEIDRYAIRVEKATRDRDLQRRYLDAVQNLNDIPASTMSHETEKLLLKEGALKEAIAELETARAKLVKAQKDYQYTEYQYSLELSKREIEIQRQQQEYSKQTQEFEKNNRDREFQIAQVTARSQEIETQLAALSVVRSQYNGKIQRVKFLEQSNTAITVELTVITDDLRSFSRRDKDPSPETASGEKSGSATRTP